MATAAHRLGARGEDRAARLYADAGYEILARNWRVPDGELDLVAGAPGLLVFVEVKTRSSDAFGHPAEAVTPAKQERIHRLAAQFCTTTGERRARHRFDVVAIIGPRIDVLEDCF